LLAETRKEPVDLPGRDPPPAAGRAPAAAWPLALICLGAVVVRALTFILQPDVVWPDETFQATEQALRLLTGQGMTPWEFQIGARSWILPGLALPWVAIGRALSTDPRTVYGLIGAVMIAVAVVNVWSAYVIGARIGRLQALFAAGLAAGWCELVYYSPHLLPDTVAGALLLAALALASGRHEPRRLVWIGVLLGSAFVVRVQLAPAIAVVGLAACRGAVLKRGSWLAAGFLLPVAFLGGLDWLTWGAPFRSVLVYVRTNLGGVASAFGVTPPLAYLGTERSIWGPALALIIATATLGAKRAPTTLAVALVVLFTFSAVGHKEPRFIYPALLPLFVTCGIGTVELAQEIGRRLRAPQARRLVPWGLALVWAAASAGAGLSAAMRPFWTRETDVLSALAAVNGDPAACGLGLDAPEWVLSGQSRLRRDIPLYDGAEAPIAAYNRLLRLPGPGRPLAAYAARRFTQRGCYGSAGVCLYQRAGGCASGAAPLRAVTAPAVRATLEKLGFTVY